MALLSDSNAQFVILSHSSDPQKTWCIVQTPSPHTHSGIPTTCTFNHLKGEGSGIPTTCTFNKKGRGLEWSLAGPHLCFCSSSSNSGSTVCITVTFPFHLLYSFFTHTCSNTHFLTITHTHSTNHTLIRANTHHIHSLDHTHTQSRSTCIYS